MESNRVIVGTIGLFIVICLVGAVLAPMINDWSTGESTTNEGAGWIRMEYLSEPDGSVQTTIGADGITVSRSGMDTQTGSDDTIIVATSTITVWWEDGHLLAMGQKFNGGDIITIEATTEMDVQLLYAGGASRCDISIDNDPDTAIRFEMPTWAYLPKSTGNYGFFPNGTEVTMEEDKPLAAVGGGFAGVYANNAVARYGLPLTMQTSTTADGKIDGVTWVKASAQQDQRSVTTTIILHPTDPGTIRMDPDSSPMVRSVPTPTYTDGDWGYDVSGGKATIVSYSGAGGGTITIPSTVGGYTVTTLGKGGYNVTIFASTITATELVIPSTVTTIKDNAFRGCTGLTGTLNIPESVTSIGESAFNGCSGFTGTLTLPSGLTSISPYTFQQCTGFSGNLVIPSGVTSIGNYAFAYSTGFNGTLTIPESVTSIGENAFNQCHFTGDLVIPSGITAIKTATFSENKFTGTLTIPSGVTSIDGYAFYQCTGFTGDLIIPSGVTSIGVNAFNGCTGFDGTLIIPSSVTSMNGGASFNACTKIVNVIILSDATPANNTFSGSTGITEILDLSDTIDYSQNRYGMPAAATVQDNIGDALGYVSFTEIGSDPLVPAGAAAVMLAIPVVILASLIAVAATVFIRR